MDCSHVLIFAVIGNEMFQMFTVSVVSSPTQGLFVSSRNSGGFSPEAA